MTSAIEKKHTFWGKLANDLKVNTGLYILVIPAFILLIIFSYIPMYGIILAFKDYQAYLGVSGSPWVGLENFKNVFAGMYFMQALKNTLLISLFSLVVGFIFPLIYALSLNSVENLRFKKFTQLISYAPYFISIVVVVSMMRIFFGEKNGIMNNFFEALGSSFKVDWMTNPESFYSLFVWSGLWQTLGWNSIIYISALSSVSPELYEAASLEGASKLQKIWFIDIPTILPTIVTLLILSAGGILGVGFEKAYLMYDPLNAEKSEVISTYAYKNGFISGDYGYGTAIGLFNSVVSFVVLALVNIVAKKTTNYSIM